MIARLRLGQTGLNSTLSLMAYALNEKYWRMCFIHMLFNVQNLTNYDRNGKTLMQKMIFIIFYRSKECRDKEANVELYILMILV